VHEVLLVITWKQLDLLNRAAGLVVVASGTAVLVKGFWLGAIAMALGALIPFLVPVRQFVFRNHPTALKES
jgi:hypothetical protein